MKPSKSLRGAPGRCVSSAEMNRAAQTDFDAIAEFRSGAGLENFQQMLTTLGQAARLSATILGRTKPELMELWDSVPEAGMDGRDHIQRAIKDARDLVVVLEAAH